MRVALLLCVASFVASVQEPAVLGGVVSDEARKAPLPLYLLELQEGTRFDRVTSDEGGRFSSSIPFAPGDVVVRFVDDDAVERKVMQGGVQWAALGEVTRKVKFDGKKVDVEVPAGPTFRMKWGGEQAEGSPTTPGTSSVEIVWRQNEGVEPEVTLRAGLRLEADGRAWVRFAPFGEGVAKPGGSAWLRVLSVDGLWMSEERVSDLDKVGELELVWRPCARWTGVLKENNGRGVPGTWVRLERFDEKGGVRERRRTRCDGGGKYAFDALGAGTWRLSGDPLRFQPFQSEMRAVTGGEVSKLSVVLEAAREVAGINGRIEGVGVAEGRAVPGEPGVIVRRAGDPLPLENVRAGWKVEGGRYVALFIVPRLPLGEYDLELVPAAGDVEGWSALSVRAKAGGTAVFTHR